MLQQLLVCGDGVIGVVVQAVMEIPPSELAQGEEKTSSGEIWTGWPWDVDFGGLGKQATWMYPGGTAGYGSPSEMAPSAVAMVPAAEKEMWKEEGWLAR